MIMATRGPTKMPKKIRPPAHLDKDVVGAQVLESMEFEGLSTTKACQAAGIAFSTFIYWVRDDPELAARHTRAREIALESMAAEIMEIADSPIPLDNFGKTDHGAVQKQKLQIDTRKWILSKLAPKKYGDKVEVDHTGTVKIDAITRKVVDPNQPLVID